MGIQKRILDSPDMDRNHTMGFIHIGVWDYDVIEDEGFWSDKTYEIFGIDRGQVPTLELVYNLIHPDDRNRFINQVNKAIEEKRSFLDNWRIIKNNNMEHMINVYANVILDENQYVVRLIGYVVDASFQEQLLQQAFEFGNPSDV